MKFYKSIVIVAIALFSTIASFAQINSASLTAAGLTCAMCTKAINTSLEDVSFIESVKADIKNSSFEITFKQGSTVNLDEVKKAVEDAGFSIAKLKINADFGNINIENDAHIKLSDKTYHFVNVKSQAISGLKSYTVVDKNFIGQRDFKKYAASTKMSCIHTGKMETCCSKESAKSESARIHHLTL